MTVQKRKLIEVALPLEAINAAGRAEKNRKTGTVRNVHKWFAPMPGPVWRALLAACIVDDPATAEERTLLLDGIAGLVPSDGSIAAADPAQLLKRWSSSGAAPALDDLVVVDPFVGGGSTLIEAQRLGLEVLGGDLNPVPTLISRTLVELYPSLPDLREPRVDTTRRLVSTKLDCVLADTMALAREIQEIARERIGHLYPLVDGRVPYAYLWAHAVPCLNPACEVLVPLLATSVLSKQKNLQAWLQVGVENGRVLRFNVSETMPATKSATKATRGTFKCPGCGTAIGVEHVKSKPDALTVVPVAVMASDGQKRLIVGSSEAPEAFVVPAIDPNMHSTPLPDGGLGLRIQAYGMESYEDLFSPRQMTAVSTFADIVRDVARTLPARVGNDDYARFLAAMLGLCVGKMAHSNSKQSTWRIDSRNGAGKVEAGFGQSILAMVWDFAEANPFGGSVGDWLQIVETSLRGLGQLDQHSRRGRVVQSPAQLMHLKTRVGARNIVATDPPYFDAIGYADLSDFFYIWHRDALREVFPDLYATASVPRHEELVADKSRHGGDSRRASDFFIEGFKSTFHSLLESADPEFPMIIVYAHQQKDDKLGESASSGWEALLEALIQAGISVTASWPIHCTSSTRLRGQDSNALSAYVALVCRARSQTAEATSRRNFVTALRAELPQALRSMLEGSIAPIDLAQASVGPGMAVFSRYSRVTEADGSDMSVRTALALINQVLAEVLEDQQSDFDAETRFCVKWFTQFGWNEGLSGDADALARAVNTSVAAIERGGIFRAAGGKARLLDPAEMVPNWNPAADKAISVWEVALRVAHALRTRGTEEAAALMAGAASRVDLGAVKELAYLLYSIAEARSWSDTAVLFNGLGTSWSDLRTSLRSVPARQTAQGLFDLDSDEGDE